MTLTARTLALLLASILFRVSVTFGQENFSIPDQRRPPSVRQQQRQFLYDQLLDSYTSTGQQLPIIQCCHPRELYRPGIDYCKNESSALLIPMPSSFIDGEDADDGEISIVTLMLTLNGQQQQRKLRSPRCSGDWRGALPRRPPQPHPQPPG